MSKMKKSDGTIAQTDEESAEAVREHFETEVFARESPYNQASIDEMEQRPTREDLGLPPTIEELKKAIARSNRDKAPGETGIPAEAFKALDDDNLLFAYTALTHFWNNPEVDAVEFHTVLLKLLPKGGDASLPKNWRPICLIDTCMQLVSSIITTRLDRYLVDSVGLQEQSGFSSARGCADSIAALKITLQNLSATDQEAFVLFVDLVKAFDSVNREMLWQVLKKMGLPEALINVIKKMYHDVQIKADVNGIVFTFSSKSGVKQGDKLAPILFLFAIQAALESMDRNWPAKKPLLQWCAKTNDDGTPQGCLTKRNESKKKLQNFEFNRCLFADDAAFIFLDRKDIEAGTEHICSSFRNFGLEVHLGSRQSSGKDIKSKTEFMHVPKRGNTSSESDTADVNVYGNRFVSHCETFRYLGSGIKSDLTDTDDVLSRIKKANWTFQHFTPVLLCKKIKRELRVQIYKTMIQTTLLWGADTWALTCKLYDKLEVLQNKHIRRLSFTTLFDCKDYHVKMNHLRDRVNLPTVKSTIINRQVHYLRKCINAPATRLTRKMIACQAARPTDCTILRRGNIASVQSAYRYGLETAGLCEKTKSGSLQIWGPRINDENVCDLIDQNLKLPKGTHKRGCRNMPKDKDKTN
jgi:hypothetical protein